MSKVVVIGTGTMGVGIAAGFLACGAKTIILGRDQAKADGAAVTLVYVSDPLPPMVYSDSTMAYGISAKEHTKALINA